MANATLVRYGAVSGLIVGLLGGVFSAVAEQPDCGPGRPADQAAHDVATIEQLFPYVANSLPPTGPRPFDNAPFVSTTAASADPCSATFGFRRLGSNNTGPLVWGPVSAFSPSVTIEPFGFDPVTSRRYPTALTQLWGTSVVDGDYASLFFVYPHGADEPLNPAGGSTFGSRLGVNLMEPLSIGDWLPVGNTLGASATAFVPSGGASLPTGWQGLSRPTIENQVDLITGRPLAQFTDLELPFDGATFRLTRTKSWIDNLPEGEIASDPEDKWWDWVGTGWMASENPILLIDSAVPNVVGDNPRTTRLILDAHHSIPFQLIESDGRYEAPPRFRATLTHNGEWNAASRSWYWPANGNSYDWRAPTVLIIRLYDGAITYTFSPVYDEMPRNVWYGQQYLTENPPNEGALEESVVVSSNGQSSDRPLVYHDRPLLPNGASSQTWMQSHPPFPFFGDDKYKNPGFGMPYFGLCTRIQDAYGHSVEIEYCDVKRRNIDDKLSDDCIECMEDSPGKGQIRAIRLVKHSPGNPNVGRDVAWTLVYTHRRFTGVDPPTGGLPPLGPYILDECPDTDPDRYEFQGHSAIDRIYAYKGDLSPSEVSSVDEAVHFTDTSTWDQDFTTPGSLSRNEPINDKKWTHQVRYHYDFWHSSEIPIDAPTAPAYSTQHSGRAKSKPLLIMTSSATREPLTPSSVRVRRHVMQYDSPRQFSGALSSPWLAAVFYPEDVERALSDPWQAGTASPNRAPTLCSDDGFDYLHSVTLEMIAKPYLNNVTGTIEYSPGVIGTHLLRQHASVQFDQRELHTWPTSDADQFLPSQSALWGAVEHYIRRDKARCVDEHRDHVVGAVSVAGSSGSKRHLLVHRILFIDDGAEESQWTNGASDWLNRRYDANSQTYPTAPQISRWFIPYQWRAYGFPQRPDASACTKMPILTDPRYISVIDEFDSRASLNNCRGDSYAATTGVRPGQISRRVVEINAAGVILTDRTWQFGPGGTTVDGGGLGEQYIYETIKDYLERKTGAAPASSTPWIPPGATPQPLQQLQLEPAGGGPSRETLAELLLVQKRSVGWSVTALTSGPVASDQDGSPDDGLVEFYDYKLFPPVAGLSWREHLQLISEGIRKGRGENHGSGGVKYLTRYIARDPSRPSNVTHEVRFTGHATTFDVASLGPPPTPNATPPTDYTVTYYHTHEVDVEGEPPIPGEPPQKRVAWRRVIGPPRKLAPDSTWYYPIEREEYDTSGNMTWSITGLVTDPSAETINSGSESNGPLSSLIMTCYLRDDEGRPKVTILDARPGDTVQLPAGSDHLIQMSATQPLPNTLNGWGRIPNVDPEAFATVYAYDQFGPTDVIFPKGKRWARRWVVNRPVTGPAGNQVAHPKDYWVEEYTFTNLQPTIVNNEVTQYATVSPVERKLFRGEKPNGGTYSVERGSVTTESIDLTWLETDSDTFIEEDQATASNREWSDNASDIEFEPFARVQMALDANGRPREATLLERDPTGAMLAVGSKEINELVDVRREREIDGNLTRMTRNLLGQHMRTYVGTRDAAWEGDRALTFGDGYGNRIIDPENDDNTIVVAAATDHNSPNHHNMILTERIEYGVGIHDAWLPTVHRRYMNHDRSWADEFYSKLAPGVDDDGYPTVTQYDWRMRPVRVDVYDRPTSSGQGARLSTTLTYLDHGDRPRLVVTFGADDGAATLNLGSIPNPVTSDLDDPPAPSLFLNLALKPLSVVEYIYGPDQSANEIRTYDIAATFQEGVTPPYQAEFHYFGRGGKETFSQRAGGTATITDLDALGRPSSVATVAVGHAGSSAPYAYQLNRSEFDYDDEGNVIEERRLERIAPASNSLEVSGVANAVRSRTLHWYDSEKRKIATAELGTEALVGSLGIFSPANSTRERPVEEDDVGWWASIATADGVITDSSLNGLRPPSLRPLHADGIRTWIYTFDRKGNAVCTVEPSGTVARNVYDSRNRLINRMDNSLGVVLNIAQSQPPRDPVGLMRSTRYDYKWGRVQALWTETWGGFGLDQSNPKDQVNSVEYGADILDDTFAKVSRNNALVGSVFVRGPNGNDRRFTLRYNFAGQIAERTDARNVTFRYSYDALQRLKYVQVGMYNASGTSFSPNAVDPLNLIDGSTPANLMTSVEYFYNPRGQLAAVETRHANKPLDTPVRVNFTYDLRGNLLSENQAHNGTSSPGTETIEYMWDYQPTNVAAFQTGHTRLTNLIYPAQLDLPSREVGVGYGASTSDLSNRLSRIAGYTTNIGAVTNLASFSHTGSGRRSRLTLGNGAIVQDFDTAPGSLGLEGLDLFGQSLTVKYVAASNNSTLFAADYRYDLAGNRTATQLTQVATSGPGPDQSRSSLHHYNQLGQLIGTDIGPIAFNSAENGGTLTNSHANRADTWRLDALGNWNGNHSQWPSASVQSDWGRATYLNGVLVAQFADTHALDNAIAERRTFVFDGAPLSTPSAQPFTYDASGNLTADGTYTYSYDAWNRLVQVNLKADPVNNQPVLGPLVKHFTYDGLGRLIRTLSPYPGPSEHNNILRAEHFYYDGVRRIQEVVGHPIKSLEGLTESEIYELLLLAWAEFGVGEQPPDIKTVSTKLEEAQLELLGPGGNTSYLAREYVWGPGDGRGGVDELLVLFDRNRDDGPSREPWFVLQDDGGDIVALCDLGGTPAVPPSSPPNTPPIPTARVAAQWTYDAYGECLSADSLLAHPTMHAGHKGLFIDRLNEGIINLYTGDPTPRLAADGERILYQNRNRVYAPGLGRFMQQDPNASGQGLLAAAAYSGRGFGALSIAFGQEDRFADGLNLYCYLESSPLRNSDPAGLFVGASMSGFDGNGRSDPFDMVDEYIAEDMGSKAAFLDRVVDTAHVTAYLVSYAASYSGIPTLAIAGMVGMTVLGEPASLAADPTWQTFQTAMGFADMARFKYMLMRAGFSAAKTAVQYVMSQGSRSGVRGGVFTARAAQAVATQIRKGPPAAVYLGIRNHQAVYVGISNDVLRRQSEHGGRFRLLQITPTLPRTLALGIETAIMMSNPRPPFENTNVPDRQASALENGIHYVLRSGLTNLPAGVSIQSLNFTGVYFP